MAQDNTAASCPFTNASEAFDPFDQHDPFPFYEWARANEPVFYSDKIDSFVVARHEDVKNTFDNWQLFSSENAQAPVRPMCAEGKQIMKDGGFTAYSGLSARVPPEHTRIRKVVQTCFGPRRFRAIEPQIRDVINAQIDRFAQDGSVDFFKEFAYDVPALVLFKLIGIPDEDVPKVKKWGASRAMLTWGNLTDEEQLPHAHNMVEYWAYCRDIVAKRHVEQTDDLPGDLVRKQLEGADISDDEIAGALYSILFAGHETTTTLMGNGVRELLTHRDTWQALIDDPSKIPGTTDELLRYTPSIVAWRRKALQDTQIGGVDIPKGSDILLLIGSANHDEEVFQNASKLDINRKDTRNLMTFGYGIHFCVGLQLAKLEYNVMLQELTRRLPSLRLKADQKIEFAKVMSFRVPNSLEVEWDVA